MLKCITPEEITEIMKKHNYTKHRIRVELEEPSSVMMSKDLFTIFKEIAKKSSYSNLTDVGHAIWLDYLIEYAPE